MIMFNFLDRNHKIRYIKSIVLGLFASLSEILSLISIPFFLNLLLKKEYFFFDKVEFINDYLINLSYSKQLLIVFFSILIIFMLKFLLQIINVNYLTKFIDKFKINIIRDTIIKTFSLSLNVFIKKNESEYQRLVTGEATTYAEAVKSEIELIKEISMAVFIIFGMLIADPNIVIVLFVVSVFGYIIYSFFSPKILAFGNEFLEKKRTFFKQLKNTIQGFTELKLIPNYSDFINNLVDSSARMWKIQRYNLLINLVPRLFLEITSLILLGFFIFFYIFVNNLNETNIIIKISFFFLCLFRLIPLANNVIRLLNFLNFVRPTILNVRNFFTFFNKNEKKNHLVFKSINKNTVIKVVNLKFKYNEKYIFSKLNFEINKGDIVHLKGNSGTGKSTLIKLLTGLMSSSENNDIIYNEEYLNNYQDKKLFSYISQEPYIFDTSLQSNITLDFKFDQNNEYYENIDHQKFNKICSLCDLDTLIEQNKNLIIQNRATNISGGQRQKIALARALYANSKILILDEATNQIDEITEEKILNSIINLKKYDCIIYISHSSKNLSLSNKTIEL